MKNSMKYLSVFSLIFLINIGLSAQNVPTGFEAESGTLGADFDPAITEGDITYITVETNGTAAFPESADRVATYSITFPVAGQYDLYGRFRVGAGGADDDSFFYGNGFGVKALDDAEQWIRMNNLNTIGFFVEDQFVTGGGTATTEIWKWLNFSEFTGDEAPLVFTVEEGNLTVDFQIGGREDGMDFDKFAFAPASRFYTVANLENGEEGSATLPDPDATPPIAEGQAKFIGNVYSTSQLEGFTNYWNQVTPENAGKWGSVEGTRDQYNWGQLDASYALAKDNGYPFKLHVLIWGNQQPTWIESLSTEDQLDEIIEWMDTLAARYPDIDYVEVVNEPLHDAPSGTGNGNYIEALGGNGATGWDWVITSFELARARFPNAELMLNDYGIINDANAVNQYLQIINLLKAENLIDQIGIQCHAFNVNDLSASTITANLNTLGNTGLPIYVTELDIDGATDELQLSRYQRVFPALWENSHVQGITLWGYRPGMWRTDQMAYLIEEDGVTERPALKWLRGYVNDNFVEVTAISITTSSGNQTIDVKGGTLDLTANFTPEDATITDVVWSVDNQSIATIDANGKLTAKGTANGTVTATATSKDGSSTIGTVAILVSNQVDAITGLDERNEFVLYPNPVSNAVFTIQGVENITSIKIRDLRGNIVQTRNLNRQSSIEVLLQNSPGVYMVELNDGMNLIYKKILLK